MKTQIEIYKLDPKKELMLCMAFEDKEIAQKQFNVFLEKIQKLPFKQKVILRYPDGLTESFTVNSINE